MIFNAYLLCIIVVFFEVINAMPYRRFRRQRHLSNIERRSVRFPSPSGSIPGTAYYGIASDPNYGSYVAKPNRPGGGGLIPISYSSNSDLYRYLVKPNNIRQQQQYQKDWYNHNYNRNSDSQTPNSNNYYNRYQGGNQGWYAGGGGRYGFNKGQSVIVRPCLLFITIVILGFCK